MEISINKKLHIEGRCPRCGQNQVYIFFEIARSHARAGYRITRYIACQGRTEGIIDKCWYHLKPHEVKDKAKVRALKICAYPGCMSQDLVPNKMLCREHNTPEREGEAARDFIKERTKAMEDKISRFYPYNCSSEEGFKVLQAMQMLALSDLPTSVIEAELKEIKREARKWIGALGNKKVHRKTA